MYTTRIHSTHTHTPKHMYTTHIQSTHTHTQTHVHNTHIQSFRLRRLLVLVFWPRQCTFKYSRIPLQQTHSWQNFAGDKVNQMSPLHTFQSFALASFFPTWTEGKLTNKQFTRHHFIFLLPKLWYTAREEWVSAMLRKQWTSQLPFTDLSVDQKQVKATHKAWSL